MKTYVSENVRGEACWIMMRLRAERIWLRVSMALSLLSTGRTLTGMVIHDSQDEREPLPGRTRVVVMGATNSRKCIIGLSPKELVVDMGILRGATVIDLRWRIRTPQTSTFGVPRTD